MRRIVTFFAVALFVAACAPNSPQAQRPAANAEAVEQAIAAAVEANKKADEVGFQWRDADALIKQAQEAAAKEDYEAALRLARTAQRHGELAYQQYLSQRDLKPQVASQ